MSATAVIKAEAAEHGTGIYRQCGGLLQIRKFALITTQSEPTLGIARL